VSALTIALLYAFMKFTFMGKALRAVAQDRETAGLMGVNPNQLIMLTFVIASALAGMGGAMLGPILVLTPFAGTTVILKAFAMLTDRVRISRRGCFLVVAVIIALLPFVIQDSYWRTNLVVCAINIMLAIGLDFILGYAGQLNLGHSAFYGIGAYASTLLAMKLGVPFWVAFVFGMVLSGAAGMALSIFAVRLRGHYLAIASQGFVVLVVQVLLN